MVEPMSDNLGELQKEVEKQLVNSDREADASDSSTISDSNKQRMSVLLKLLTAIQDEKEYRQQLLMADFIDDEEADRVAAALAEAKRYQLGLSPILDWVIARCAVNKDGHGKSRSVLSVEGLTHSSFSVLGGKGKKAEKEGGRTNEPA